LIGQFFFESVMTAFFAFLISLVLAPLSLHFFNQLADKKLVIFWASPVFWLLGLGFSLLTGVIAGSYPALYLSSFAPVKVLKGVFRAGPGAAIPRKVLVVLQFTVSVVLIIGTIIVFRQVQFVEGRPIGYDRNGLVECRITSRAIQNHLGAVKQELLNAGAIKDIVESSDPVSFAGMEWSLDNRFDWSGKNPGMGVAFHLIDLSSDYGKTVGWQFIQGRDFSAQYSTDSSAFVVNEAAAKFMGFTNAVGEIVRSNKVPYTIIGVIRDMVMGSPYEPAKPSFFRLNKRPALYVIIKLNPARNAGDALGVIETVFKKYNPDQPFDYRFVDAEYAKKFIDEERIGKLASFFTILAIFISCLGLFGMASFVAEQRTKEIGVRKLLGASVPGLWGLLSVGFVKLVTIALLIALPVSWYFMHKWLQGYTYRTELSWWIFAVTAIGAILVTLLTISWQIMKAALANPIKSLKSE
jgi:hypothetical protein